MEGRSGISFLNKLILWWFPGGLHNELSDLLLENPRLDLGSTVERFGPKRMLICMLDPDRPNLLEDTVCAAAREPFLFGFSPINSFACDLAASLGGISGTSVDELLRVS